MLVCPEVDEASSDPCFRGCLPVLPPESYSCSFGDSEVICREVLGSACRYIHFFLSSPYECNAVLLTFEI